MVPARQSAAENRYRGALPRLGVPLALCLRTDLCTGGNALPDCGRCGSGGGHRRLEAAKPQTRIRLGVAGLRRGGNVSDFFGGVETASAAARADRVCADGGDGRINGVAGNQAKRADYGAGRLGRRSGGAHPGIGR